MLYILNFTFNRFLSTFSKKFVIFGCIVYFSILYHGCPTQTAPVWWATWSSTRVSKTTWAVVEPRPRAVLPSSDSKLLAGKSCPTAAMELSLKKSRKEVLQILWDIYYQVWTYSQWYGTKIARALIISRKKPFSCVCVYLGKYNTNQTIYCISSCTVSFAKSFSRFWKIAPMGVDSLMIQSTSYWKGYQFWKSLLIRIFIHF